MANVLVQESSLQDIASAIRTKNGTQTTYKPSQMADAITNLPSGGVTPTGTINITANGTHDVTNYASASVNVPTGTTPTGTKQISITQNGTTTEDVSDYANAEINVNVSSGGSGSATVTNIIDTTGVTYVTGYIATNGSISSAGSATKEVTTGFIDISAFQGETIQAWLTVANHVLPWAAVMFYTDAEAIIGSRVTAIESWTSNTYASSAAFTAVRVVKNADALGIGAQLTVPSTAKYIRISFRTGGNGALVLTDDISTSQDFVDGNVATVSFANALISNGTAS